MLFVGGLLALLSALHPQGVPLSPSGVSVDAFAVSPDGSTALFTTRTSPPELYTVSLVDLRLELRTSASFTAPSIDEIEIAPLSNAATFWSASQSALYATPLKAPGAATRLDPATPGVSGPGTFGPRSGRVYFRFQPTGSTAFDLYGARPDGGLPPRMLNAPLTPGARVEEFRVSPDGRTVVYLERHPGGIHLRRVIAVPSAGGAAVVLLEATTNRDTRLIAFTPDSSRLRFIHGERLQEVLVDGSSAPSVLLDLPLPGEHLFLSPDESGLIVDGAPGIAGLPLYFIDLASSAAPVLLDSEVDYPWDVVWSRDRTWVVFTNDETGSGSFAHFELRSVPLDGTLQPVALAAITAVDPPYEDVQFHSSATAADVLWNLSSACWARNQFGVGPARRLTPTTALVQRFERTPDERIVFSTPDRLYLLPEVAPVPPIVLSAIDGGRFVLTPEGRRVLYVRAGRLYLHYLVAPFLPHRR